ncbi:hypothetical protein HALO32_02579 [Halomonas lysinitropha]|uniref:Uncharacterized protein n=1 Tax=Halomonas lysinitropha TaxID=2607506 RepID=A0A5K1IBZ6_9GAMM|nr:hypothetical protein HALO32_02579 [Halomonas lysinitropha]
MFEPLEEQQQWELEVRLGFLIRQLQDARLHAEDKEQDARALRKKEAELAEEVRKHRQQLGLPDGPTEHPAPVTGDDQEPPSGSGDGPSGFQPFGSPQVGA